jgi:MFS family permease
MLINIAPLKKYRDYRLLFFGQMVSFLGSMVSYVAVPYQVYELTKSNAMVGALGLVQLGPVLIFGILGGAYADRLNRRKLLLISEIIMTLTVFLLMVNAALPSPSVVAIYILVAIMQGVLGFHRPSMEALTQKMVEPSDYSAVGALGSFRFSVGAIAGPALGGALIASFGLKGAYFFDFLTFFVALICIYKMTSVPNPEARQTSPLSDIKEGLSYALSKPELIGTYLIDIVAMVFAFPVALFPAMSEGWGGAKAAGILFSSMACGALIATLLSGWTSKVTRHGKMVVIAASMWGLFMIGVGFASQLWIAVLFLALAGGADMISGLFRGVIWNHSVENKMRGRLSGIEMISYMSGPLLGNARAGWVASQTSVTISLWSGGIICFIAVVITALLLPKFWSYVGDKK